MYFIGQMWENTHSHTDIKCIWGFNTGGFEGFPVGNISRPYPAGESLWLQVDFCFLNHFRDKIKTPYINPLISNGTDRAGSSGCSNWPVRKLIVLDEADNLQGTADRGGAKAIIECIRKAQQPMILIANDLYGLSPELRFRCEPVQFRAIPARSIGPRLRYLCAAEKITCSDAAIHAIAESAEGDIRSAVNMLYASAIGRERLDDIQVHASQKDERVSIFSLITAIFHKTQDEDLMRLSYDVDDTPETIEQWVEGNMHLLPSLPAVARGYRYLARADEYLGYTYRRQYYTLWRYATALMLLGVAEAAEGKGIHTRIIPPERWQKMSAAKKQKAIRMITLSKFAGIMHIPQNTLRENYLDIISLLVEHDPANYASELMFDTDQLNFFLHDKARSQEIIKFLLQEDKVRGKEQQKKPLKEKVQKPEQRELEEPSPAPEPAEKKQPLPSQSTLFDGF